MLNTQDFLSKCFTLPGSQNTPSYSTERLKSRLHKQSLPTQAFKSLIFQSLPCGLRLCSRTLQGDGDGDGDAKI